jgi:hypothetical protein
VRDAIAKVASTATDRLDICACDLTRLPEWLQTTPQTPPRRAPSEKLAPRAIRTGDRRPQHLVEKHS